MKEWRSQRRKGAESIAPSCAAGFPAIDLQAGLGERLRRKYHLSAPPRLCERNLLFFEHPSRLVTVGFHLCLERVEAVELRFRADEAVEGDFDFLAVEVAGEVEEIGLE